MTNSEIDILIHIIKMKGRCELPVKSCDKCPVSYECYSPLTEEKLFNLAKDLLILNYECYSPLIEEKLFNLAKDLSTNNLKIENETKRKIHDNNHRR